MRFALNFYLFLFVLLTFSDKSFSLSDYQIREACKKEKRKSNCIKNLREKRSKLQKGNLIEIPIIPYRR